MSTDLSALVNWLNLSTAEWCVIGGAAVDHYAPPAIFGGRLDVATDRKPDGDLLGDLLAEGFRVRLDARNQVAEVQGHQLTARLCYGTRFRSMPAHADRRPILGQALPVAALADVAAGLLAVRADPGEHPHNRRKAELDLLRLAEAHADQMDDLLPPDLRTTARADREHALAYAGGDGWGESPAL